MARDIGDIIGNRLFNITSLVQDDGNATSWVSTDEVDSILNNDLVFYGFNESIGATY